MKAQVSTRSKNLESLVKIHNKKNPLSIGHKGKHNQVLKNEVVNELCGPSIVTESVKTLESNTNT